MVLIQTLLEHLTIACPYRNKPFIELINKINCLLLILGNSVRVSIKSINVSQQKHTFWNREI